MPSLNRATLLGNLGRDPEVRRTPSGMLVVTLRLATTRPRKGERKPEDTDWHNVVLFDKLAEVAEKYLKKGQSVYIEGYMRTRKWQDKDGGTRYTTEVVGNDLQLMGGGHRDDHEHEPAPASTSTNTAAPSAPRTEAQEHEHAQAEAAVQMDDPPF